MTLGKRHLKDVGVIHGTFYVAVTAVNDAPRVRVPGMIFRSSPATDSDYNQEGEYELAYVKPLKVDEDIELPIPGVNIDVDMDRDGKNEAVLRVVVKAVHGYITLGADGELPEGVQILSGKNGGSMVTLRTTLHRANSALQYHVYRGDQDWFGTDFLSIFVDDLGNVGIGGVKTDLQRIPIEVVAVSDPPVWNIPEVPFASSEDASLARGIIDLRPRCGSCDRASRRARSQSRP